MPATNPLPCRCSHFVGDHTGAKSYHGKACTSADCPCTAYTDDAGPTVPYVCMQCSTWIQHHYGPPKHYVSERDTDEVHTLERCRNERQRRADARPPIDRSRGGLRWGLGYHSGYYHPDGGGFNLIYGNTVDIIFDHIQDKQWAHDIARDLMKAGIIPDEEGDRRKLQSEQMAAVIKAVVGPKEALAGSKVDIAEDGSVAVTTVKPEEYTDPSMGIELA